MHRRYEHVNIPTEIVRTVVAISQTGSYSKAGERLGLSQPAISAQVKRLQVLIGGALFEKSARSVTFNERGKLVLTHAKKLLEANDQILSIGGATREARSLRLGLASPFVDQFFRTWSSIGASELSIICDHSSELAQNLSNGYLDVACLLNPPDDIGASVMEWQEEHVWVRSRSFVLRPGSAIPIIAWPGSIPDQPMIQAIEQAGVAYRVVFTSADHHSRISAVQAGLGIMGLPARQVDSPLVVARDYYLPPLAPLRAGVYVRGSPAGKAFASVLNSLKNIQDDGGGGHLSRLEACVVKSKTRPRG